MRFGPLRPAVGFGSYRTPVEGLYLTGAGTHPTGGISGIPGFVAAKTLLRHLSQDGGLRPRRALAAGRRWVRPAAPPAPARPSQR
jgi:hypothetical protein